MPLEIFIPGASEHQAPESKPLASGLVINARGETLDSTQKTQLFITNEKGTIKEVAPLGQERPTMNGEYSPTSHIPQDEPEDMRRTLVETEAVKTGRAYKSDTILEAVANNEIPKLSHGLYDLVFELGSTNIDWRKDVEPILTAAGINTLNPDMGANWDPKRDTLAEAWGLGNSAELAMYIENAADIKDGSLGSLVEIGMSVYSAVISGQHVDIHFDEHFEETLEDPGAIAQFEALKTQLAAIQKKYGHLVSVEYNSTRQNYAEKIQLAMERQRNPETANKPITKEKLQEFAEKRRQRLAKKKRKVVYGGSSAPFDKSLQLSFDTEQDLIQQIFGGEAAMDVLNREPLKSAWDRAYEEGISKDEQIKRMNFLFQMEAGPKSQADILLWIIQARAESMAAITETPFLLLNALEEGQQVGVLSEDLDADFYVQHLFGRRAPDLEKTTGPLPIYDQLRDKRETITFKSIKNEPELKKTRLFSRADNVRRTRAISSQQLLGINEKARKIAGDEEIELFIFSRDLTDFAQKCQIIADNETFEGREVFYNNLSKFNDNMEAMVAEHAGDKEHAVEIVWNAIKAAVELNPFAPSLEKHLNEVKATCATLKELVAAHPDADGNPYLTPEEMKLMVDYVAPLHDILKLLGAPNVQAIPDHEVFAGYIVNTYFEKLGFTPQEVAFIAGVIGNHENIFKEKERDKYSSSEKSVDRGVALFFIADGLTGVVSEENGVIKLDPAQLDERFGKLYVNHMDPETRKVALPRPEWGFSTVKDYLATFDTLEAKYGFKFDPGARKMLIDSAVKAIDTTLGNNGKRKEEASNKKPLMTDPELINLMKTRSALKKIGRELAPAA